MKNLKKVLAMVLAFACTFSMFAGAKVFEDVPAGSDYSEAITMLSDLGVIQGKDDGKYHPEDTITRAEACAMIARLMTGDPNVNGYTGAQNFTDVVKGSWQDSAIGYCFINGIVIGDGNGKFRPGAPITDAEFITMMVRAMGYETADMKQYYPHSYISAATSVGLLDGVTMVANSEALRGEDAQVIYNALFVDYARGAKMVNTTHGTSVETYPTLAESVWKLSRAAVGTWDKNGTDDEVATLSNCKAHTWVVVGADKDKEGHILAYPIDDDTTDIYESDKTANKSYAAYSFAYEGDVESIKGYQVELWGEGSHGEPTWEKGDGKFVYSEDWKIRAIKTVKGQTKYDYDASQADSKSDNGTIELGETSLALDSVGVNAYHVKMANTTNSTVAQYLSNDEYNAVKMSNKDNDEKVEEALNVRDGAQYKLMDWDSDGDIDWVVIDEANYYKVESVSSKRLTMTSMKDSKSSTEEKETASNTTTWKLDGLNDEKDYKIKVEAPEGLEEGDIVEVTYKTSYDKGEKSEVVTATITVVEAENHELDKVSTKDNLVLTFDGETMQLAQNVEAANTIVPANPTKYEGFDEEELGTEFALWTNRNGFIVYSDYATESTNYMMVLDTDNGDDSVRGKLGAMRILTANNEVKKNVEVVADLTIDKSSTANGYNKSDRSFDETKIVGNVYKYWTNEDGQITKMESMLKADDSKKGTYEYVSKNDRLTVTDSASNSYALEDAKVIFAVKQNNTTDKSYIQRDPADAENLKVDAADVLAVKAEDIPDIKAGEPTNATKLDESWAATNEESWVGDANSQIVISANNNKDASAAVLGVNNFNKFNAASTKVGLVTNVSYDKNDVVSIDVATGGKVETISSAEKTNFDDIVSVLDYVNSKEYSVSGRNEKINNGLMTGSTLKDYLNKNAAYAEITTDAEGKLTGVLFMDKKAGSDADVTPGGKNEGNAVVGNYYQVSRKVVADVKEGSWMSVYNNKATYANKDALVTLDTKNGQTAAGFTSDVTYYTIDGKPTQNDNLTTTKAMSILDGFDGTPDIAVGEASDVRKSDVRNDSVANDLYEVADVASKVDANGNGDIVAVYMYEDSMDEAIGLNSGSSISPISAVAVGGQATITVTLASDANLDKNDVYIDIVDANGEVVVKKQKVTEGKNAVDVSKLPVGNYTVNLYGYNKANRDYDLLDSESMTISATAGVADKFTVGTVGEDGTFKQYTKNEVQENSAAEIFVKIFDKNNQVVHGLDASKIAVKKNAYNDNIATKVVEMNNQSGELSGVYSLTVGSIAGGNTLTVLVDGKSIGTISVIASAPTEGDGATHQIGEITPKWLGDGEGGTVETGINVEKGDARTLAEGGMKGLSADMLEVTVNENVPATDIKVTPVEGVDGSYVVSFKAEGVTKASDVTKLKISAKAEPGDAESVADIDMTAEGNTVVVEEQKDIAELEDRVYDTDTELLKNFYKVSLDYVIKKSSAADVATQDPGEDLYLVQWNPAFTEEGKWNENTDEDGVSQNGGVNTTLGCKIQKFETGEFDTVIPVQMDKAGEIVFEVYEKAVDGGEATLVSRVAWSYKKGMRMGERFKKVDLTTEGGVTVTVTENGLSITNTAVSSGDAKDMKAKLIAMGLGEEVKLTKTAGGEATPCTGTVTVDEEQGTVTIALKDGTLTKGDKIAFTNTDNLVLNEGDENGWTKEA